MPCDFSRSAVLGFGLGILLAAASAPPAKAQKAQQVPGRPAAQAQLPPNAIDRWNRMSPQERERELAKLPPARARQIRERIRWYNHMAPEERQALRQRYQTFSQLPPDKQQIVRQRLRENHEFPLARQLAIHSEIQHLRSLPEAQRQALMNSGEFRGRFSPQEQQIIRDLATYLPY